MVQGLGLSCACRNWTIVDFLEVGCWGVSRKRTRKCKLLNPEPKNVCRARGTFATEYGLKEYYWEIYLHRLL